MTTRRQVIKTMIGAAVAGYTPIGFGSDRPVAKKNLTNEPKDETAAANGPAERLPWRNWSGGQVCHPASRQAPASVAALQEILASSKGCIRPVGAGHSFTPLVLTDDHLISLDRLQGLVEHDDEQHQASFGAGTRLNVVAQQLDQVGQAMINMPDVDQQTLAGALATATHGTGANLACLSDYVIGMDLVTAAGDLITCSPTAHAEVFRAMQVSLGALGLITKINLQNQAAYHLDRTLDWWPIDTILEQIPEVIDRHRNFEFFYVPFTGMGLVDIKDMTDQAPSLDHSEDMDHNDGLYILKKVRDLLSWSPSLRQLIVGTYMRTLPKERSIAPSWANYTNTRAVRFNEMEYHLPREEGLNAFRKIRRLIERDFPEIFFPLEVRVIKGDDIWLSPFYRQDSMSIAVHRYFEEDYQPLFRAVEPILRQHGGRPHWGKFHSLTRDELAVMYPHWQDFQSVRKTLDPQGRFLNPYLRRLFGEGQS